MIIDSSAIIAILNNEPERPLFTYGKGRHPAQLNFGDCFSYALAKVRDEVLLFKGSNFNHTDVKHYESELNHSGK